MAKDQSKTTLFYLPDLKTIRLDLGLKKEELKTKAGLSRATIDKAESEEGYISDSSMGKLLKALTASGKKLTFADTKSRSKEE